MKVVLSLSGGLDSTTVLAWLVQNDYQVICTSFYYGSKHNTYENEAAIQIANFYGVPLHHLDISGVMQGFKSDLLLKGGDIPEGHYTDQTMDRTVVPGRNIIFLSILAGLAWSVEASDIAIGIHQGDHAIYADCRREFYKAMDTAIYLGTDQRVSILAPFVETDKVGIVKWGLAHKVPFKLTRTCYKNQPLACGKCGSCVERLEAFAINKTKDPIQYEDS